MKLIIKISPELIIKSKPVRKRAIKLLTQNIAIWLREYKEKIKITYLWDRIDVEWRIDIDEKTKNDIIKIVCNTPWVYSVFEVVSVNLSTLDNLFDDIKDLFLWQISWKTFAVRIDRSWKHEFTSIEAEKILGWLFLKNSTNSKVKLENPDITVSLNIKDNNVFVLQKKHYWIWWYPTSFQWKVLSLISWWFDSGVSTFLSMKRWCEVDFLFFNLWWLAHELWVKQVASYLWKNYSKGYKGNFITINFEEVIKELLTKVDHKYRWIILKRLMLKCASEVWQKSHFALIKWDSLWQVSSQTLANLAVIDKASSMLVLRPLIMYDKQEIIDISKAIWTYTFACNMPEYCGVISDNPATKSDEQIISAEEKNIDNSVIIKAIENKKVEKIDHVLNDWQNDLDNSLEITYIPWDNEVVVDIREDEKIKKEPLNLSKVEIIKIPFFDINHEFVKLEQDKTYLFYCDKWVLSKLHALYLKEKWFNNIKIFRPVKNDSNCKI